MQDKLAQLEKKYGVDWREFEIGELFEIKHYGTQISTDSFDREGVSEINFVMQNENNNGIIEKVPVQTNPKINLIPGNSISAFTHLSKVYYQEEPFYSKQGSNVYTLKSQFLNKKNALYFVGAINSQIKNLEYGKNTASRMKSKPVQIPIKSTGGEIAFDYIDEFVATLEAERLATLEAERLATLEAYLIATGLNNVTLSAEERSSLDKLGGAGSVEWCEFNLPSLFTIKNTHCILSRDIVENSGTVPYLTAGQGNNAVGTYVKFDESQIDEGNSIFIGGKTFVVTYQEKDYFSNDSHNLALYYKDADKRTKENQLFMATAIYKSLSHLYSWGNSISRSKIQSDCVMLPVDECGEIDFEFMTTLVKAMQKVVIKGVVEWADKRIKTTKEVIENG